MFVLNNKNFTLVCLLSSCVLVMWFEAACNSGKKKDTIAYGIAESQGYRPVMEDYSSVDHQNEYALFAVYDGHGSHEVAAILAEGDGQAIRSLSKDILDGAVASRGNKVEDVLRNAFVQKDRMFKEYIIPGSTALVALLNMLNKNIYLAWAGDSRGIVVDEDGKIILETKDHKPNDPAEQKRIADAGGMVMFRYGAHRVNGDLATSRAFGDFRLKPLPGELNPITAVPDVVTLNLQDKKPQYLVLASDGVWDVLNNEQLVSYIQIETSLRAFAASSLYDKETSNEHLEKLLACKICDAALTGGSKDNIMALVVNLKNMH